MNDTDDKVIFRPTVKSISILCASSAIATSTAIYLIDKTTSGNSIVNKIFIFLIIGFFLIIGLASFWYILKTKIINVEKSKLVIKYPLLFKTKQIDYSAVKKISFPPQIIKSSGRGGIVTVHEGERILLQLENMKTIEMNSFQTQNFTRLAEILRGKLNKIEKQ